MTAIDRTKTRGSNMKVTDMERAIFLMSPAEFNAYLAEVKRREDESDSED
jgi:hypothetical protein